MKTVSVDERDNSLNWAKSDTHLKAKFCQDAKETRHNKK